MVLLNGPRKPGERAAGTPLAESMHAEQSFETSALTPTVELFVVRLGRECMQTHQQNHQHKKCARRCGQSDADHAAATRSPWQ
jgi:hypothetical protein